MRTEGTLSTPSMRRARQRNLVRRQLTTSLHSCASLTELREAVVNVLCDWSDVDLLDPVDSEALTERGHDIAPDTAADSAPCVPADSELGREYGT